MIGFILFNLVCCIKAQNSKIYPKTIISPFESHFQLVNASHIKFDIASIEEEAQALLVPKIEKILVFFATAEWLSDKEKYLVVARVSIGIFTQSFIYITYFDRDWNQILSPSSFLTFQVPSILPIPVPDYTKDWAGPEDPRIFKGHNEEYFIVFNMLDHDSIRKIMIYSLNTRSLYPLTLKDYQELPPKEKNWAPLVTDHGLHFVYNLEDFQVIDCSDKQVCVHVTGKYSHDIGKLKPSSPFVRFGSTNYYFSFSFKHIYCYQNEISPRSYRPTITILRQHNRAFEIFYQSELDYFFDVLAYEPYTTIPKPHDLGNLEICNRERVLIIPKIVQFDLLNDETEILGFFNDEHTFVARINGIARLLQSKIEENEQKYFNLFD